MNSETYTDFAWECLRRNKLYIKDWYSFKNQETSQEYLNDIDLIAKKKWGLLKFVDPNHATPKGVFWSPELSRRSTRIILSNNGYLTWGNIENTPNLEKKKLFLLDGSLCVKVFNKSNYFQFFIDDASALNDRSNIFLYVPLCLNNNISNKNIDIIKNIINNKIEGDDKEEQYLTLLKTVDDLNKGFSHRAIASEIFGEQLVEREWSSDSWLRSNIRYRIKKATNLINTGYLNYI